VRRFVDPEGTIEYLPADQIPAAIERGATAFHVKGVEFDHRDGHTPFEAMLAHYDLRSQPALELLGRIVNGADTDNTLYNQPEGPGLRALSEGIRAQHPGDDAAIIAAGLGAMDALYAYCESKT
jgi:hypothetical protein